LFGRRTHTQRLARSLGVVTVHPRIQCCLQVVDGGERPVGVGETPPASSCEAAQPFPSRWASAARSTNAGSPFGADPIEQHVRARSPGPNRPVNTLPLVSMCSGSPCRDPTRSGDL
jgi:hypothetical protein